MKKILCVFGTRPEAIKFAPVIHELNAFPSLFQTRVCVTGQHREMLDQVLELFEIRPDHDLTIMKPGQDLFDITVNSLRELAKVLSVGCPDLLLVQGDTTTAFTASLAGYYLKIPVGHIEAGLRTEDKFNPFPEEINRRLVDDLSDLFFAPTETSRQNLLREGKEESRIFVTGNTVIDALRMTLEKQEDEKTQAEIEKGFLSEFGITFDREKIILVTGHRRESFGKGFEQICLGLKMISQSGEDVQIVYPVHLNPNVQDPVNRILEGVENIHLISPLDYYQFVWLMNRAHLILTDSGGIQEEAPFIGKPVLVMRHKTERPEAVAARTSRLVGTDSQKIHDEAMRLLTDPAGYKEMSRAVSPYGDGFAAKKIAEVLKGI